MAWLVAGCAAVPPPVRLAPGGGAATADVSHLAAVLAEAVTADGRLVPEALRRLEPRLDAQLRQMAGAGPTATPALYPTYGSRWSYWYNARAAWSMKLVSLAGCGRRVSAEGLWRRRFPLDGREMSLAGIDAVLLDEARRTGQFRLAACAPGVTVSDEPLPQAPWSAEGFTGRLDEAFNRLVLDARRFVLDVEGRQVQVPPMLWACRELVRQRYAQEYGTDEATLLTALRAYVGPAARRRLEAALGYRAIGQPRRGELAIPGRKIYFPGKIGKIEP